MKPVFKCDYCNFMGTEEAVAAHEPKCHENYDMKSCYTCIHRDGIKRIDDEWAYKCKAERDIPANSIYQFCPKYERKEKTTLLDNIFTNGLFGGFGGFGGI